MLDVQMFRMSISKRQHIDDVCLTETRRTLYYVKDATHKHSLDFTTPIGLLYHHAKLPSS